MKPIFRNSIQAAEIAVAVSVFLVMSNISISSGFRADDAGFFHDYATNDLFNWFAQAREYVPGRNLHVIWQNIFFTISATPNFSAERYHIFQSALISLNGLLGARLARTLGARQPIPTFVLLFSVFWPTHTEALLWPSALPMHILTGTFLLLLVQSFVDMHFRNSLYKIWLSFCFYILAAFTYDQGFTAGTAIFIVGLIFVTRNLPRPIRPKNKILGVSSLFVFTIGLYSYLFIVVRPSTSGPTAGDGLLERLAQQTGVFIDSRGVTGAESFLIGDPDLTNFALTMARGFIMLGIVAALLGAAYKVLNLKKAGGLISRVSDSGNITAVSLAIAIAAWIPAWAWYVSPRHNYIPNLFLVLSLAFGANVISNLLSSFNRVAAMAAIAAVVISLSPIALVAIKSSSVQANKWAEVEKVRVETYKGVKKLVIKRSLGPCVYFVNIDPALGGPFYSEFTSAAYQMYENKDTSKFVDCNRSFSSQIDKEVLCVSSSLNSQARDQTAIYFPTSGKLIEWHEPQLLTSCN